MAATLDRFSRLAALKPVRQSPARPAMLRSPNEDDPVAHLLGAGVASNHFGEHLAIRNWYSSPEFAEPSPGALDLLSRVRDKSLSRKTRMALANSEQWLFLDTETTGLAGGTGTYAFLIGIAWWDAGGLQVEQLFMRDFSEEHSLLQELSRRLAERPVLVTFNGKSFDWPLLENRFTMTRCIPKPKLAAHLDLLHPARALWKLRLGSVRLVELERRVLDPQRLGWHREDDISSSQIPQYYFDYLRGGTAAPLAGVVRHNQMDLRGLAALFGKINEMLSARENEDEPIDGLDLFGLARFLRVRGERDRARSTCSEALAQGLPSEFLPKARRELAHMVKQQGQYDRAAEMWLEIVADPQHGVHACQQLAIYYERRAKNLVSALEYAKLALAMLKRQLAPSRDPLLTARKERIEQQLLRRIARLVKKLSSSSPARPRAVRAAAGAKASSALW